MSKSTGVLYAPAPPQGNLMAYIYTNGQLYPVTVAAGLPVAGVNPSGAPQTISVDDEGNVNTNVISGGGGSNASVGPTGSAVPSDATYMGINISGDLTGPTGFSVGSQNAIAVAIVNASGAQITSFGGGTQYTDGTAESAGAFTGTVALGYNGTDVVGLRLNSSNQLLVSVSNSTLAVTQSGAWTVATNADGSPSGGTAGSKSLLVAGIYNSSAPTLTTGQQASLQLTSSGALIVSANITNSTLAVTQSGTWTVATNADGSASGGTAATKSLLAGGIYNSSAPTLTTGQQASLQLTSSGALIVSATVTQSTSPWIVAGGGTAGSPGTAVLTIQGISSGTNVPVSIASPVDGNGYVEVDLKTSIPAGTNAIGTITFNPGTGALAHANVTGSSSGATTLISGQSGKNTYIYRIVISLAGATNVEITDSTSSTILLGPYYMGPYGSIVLDNTGEPWAVTTATGDNLSISLSAAASFSVDVWYKQQ